MSICYQDRLPSCCNRIKLTVRVGRYIATKILISETFGLPPLGKKEKNNRIEKEDFPQATHARVHAHAHAQVHVQAAYFLPWVSE